MDQILVHVSAPSSARDDARYRAQVAAIRAMQPVTEAVAEVPCLPADQSAAETRHRAHAPEAISARASTPIGLDSISSQGDSLDSIVSVIPDSQPSDPQPQARQEPDPRREPPPKRRRTESEVCNGTSVPAQGTRLSPNEGIPHPLSISLPRPISVQDCRPLLNSLPVEIHPPPPPISIAPFTTHITPTLSMLVDRLNPTRTYRPVRQVRDLDKLERGYWAVQISIRPDPLPAGTTGTDPSTERCWNGELFARFWDFMIEFIGPEARAGWGVWCFLDRAPDGGSTEGGLSVLLKVYAWGEVAMHVYLLLFLASERKVRGLEAQWRDSNEEVVIQMP